jgi:hypothetical protein
VLKIQSGSLGANHFSKDLSENFGSLKNVKQVNQLYRVKVTAIDGSSEVNAFSCINRMRGSASSFQPCSALEFSLKCFQVQGLKRLKR